MEQALALLERLSNGKDAPEFLDGVALSPASVMVVAGYNAESAPIPLLSLRGNRTDPWFFWYLTDLAKKHTSSNRIIHTDYMSLDDYLFRFDRGAFWMARHGMTFLYGQSAYSSLRALWAYIGSTRQMYKMAHSPGDVRLAESYIVQDVIMPSKAAAVALTKFNTDESYHIWPLWICPIRKVEENHEQDTGLGLPLTGAKGDLLFNLGFYGPVNGGRPMNPVQKNRALEQKVFELKGKKWLYAQSFYSEEEFWAHFKKENYDLLRKQYNNHVFHDITKKVLLASSTKEAICKNCSINLWNYIHKVIPVLCSGYLELITPRSIQPWLGINHTQVKRYATVANNAWRASSTGNVTQPIL
jgi:hypothetical protein